MAIVRRYECGDCGTKFEKLHFDRAEPPPECPGCQALAARQVPAGFSIAGPASKAGDIAYDIMSKDYGYTDMKDKLREGDTAVPNLPANLQAQVANMWKPSGAIIAAAKTGAQAAAAEGRNPVSMIQRVAKARGSAQVMCRPVTRPR